MKTQSQIIELLNKSKLFLKERGVIELGLYGSYARHTQKNTSDVDVWVKLENHANLLDIAQIKLYLENLLKLEVDIIRHKCFRNEIRSLILTDSVVIW